MPRSALDSDITKVVAFLKRKPGLSLDDFVQYYEHRHVPLVREILPSIGRYIRNYVLSPPLSGLQDAPLPFFDVVTELWFDTVDAYGAYAADLGDPVVVHRLREDERNFLDQSVSRSFLVAEYGAPVHV